MIKIKNIEVLGWEHAIRGMRNPMNSWDKSDTGFVSYDPDKHFDCIGERLVELREGDLRQEIKVLGPNDYNLMTKLAKGGPVHAKYRRMITVYLDITAPLYWWKEFDTYKVGTVANSCSTMHKIHEKEFTLDDFSCEHLIAGYLSHLKHTIKMLNDARDTYFIAKKMENPNPIAKDIWWQMIQLLPSSYNQKRTIMLNYEVLVGMYRDRKNHKLDEWREFCKWIESLPYSEIITGMVVENEIHTESV